MLAGLAGLPGVSPSPSHGQRHHQHPDWGAPPAQPAQSAQLGATTPRGPLAAPHAARTSELFGAFGEPGAGSRFDAASGSSGFRQQLAAADSGAAALGLQASAPSPEAGDAAPVTEYVINEHQQALLGCDVPTELLNLVQIFWFHDGAPTETVVVGQLSSGGASASGGGGGSGSSSGDSDAGHRYVRDPTTGSLTIAAARMEDDGVWGCQAKEATSRRVLHTGPAVRLIVLGNAPFRPLPGMVF